MGEKVFKTIEQQVELLTSRGLIIPDEDMQMAKEFLLHNNYYRISGYTLTLRKQDVFYEDVTIRNVIDIYNFDHELRAILMESLEIVEVKIKSVFAYDFAKKYGGKGYRDSKYFSDTTEFLRIIEKTEQQKDKNLSDEAYIQHYVNDLQEVMPVWAWVDLLTFSDISKLFTITKKEIKIEIAKDMGISAPNDEKRVELVEKYLRELTVLRNFCAHGRRLYNRLFVCKPSLNSKEKKLLLQIENDGKTEIDNAHLFGFILVMRRILSVTQFEKLKRSLESLSDKYLFVNMKHYGFPENWKEIL